jgi:hypothetical protein
LHTLPNVSYLAKIKNTDKKEKVAAVIEVEEQEEKKEK